MLFSKEKRERKDACAALVEPAVIGTGDFRAVQERRTDPFSSTDDADDESLPPHPPFFSFSFLLLSPSKKKKKQVKHDENEHRTGVARAGRDNEPLSWNDFLTL